MMATGMRSVVIQKKYRRQPRKQLSLVTSMMSSSKHIYNSAVYFQRKWYEMIQLLCAYQITHMDEYISRYTESDVRILFKYSIQHNHVEHAKRLYCLNGDSEWLRFVRDDNLRRIFQSMTSDNRCPKGDHQTNQDIINSINKLDLESSSKQLKEFKESLWAVLSKAMENRTQTLARQKITKASCSQKRKSATQSICVLPPTYLGLTYMDLYVKQNIPSYKAISSQVAQQTIKKVDEAYKSFFSNPTDNRHLPRYQRVEKYNLIFQKNSFKVTDCKEGMSKLRLSLGNSMKKQMKAENEETFLSYKVPSRILRGKQVVEVELVPSQYKTNDSYQLIAKYKIDVPDVMSTENLKKASIDLGVVNLVTLFSPCLSTPIIYSGKALTGMNKVYNQCIDNLKSYIKTNCNQDSCHKLENLWTNRSNRIKDFFHRIAASVIDYCKQYDIKELIIGYNTNWKKSINIGRANNRKFCEIPYRKLVSMLFDKGQKAGIKVVENEESYTSKCDALGLEDIYRQEKYMGRREKRGLFASSVGVLINADVNGAINIMRKHVYKTYAGLSHALNSTLQNLPFRQLCNPVVLFRKLSCQDCSAFGTQSSGSNRGRDYPSTNLFLAPEGNPRL